MSRTQLLSLTAAIAALFVTRATAQSTRLTLGPESTVRVQGKSNIRNWSCATSAFETTLDVDSSAPRGESSRSGGPKAGLSVTVPVRSLKCGRDKMDSDLYRTLKADSFPEIRFALVSYRVLRTLVVPDSFWATAAGELTVAGKTKAVEVKLRGQRESGGAVSAEGGVKLLMTDFGIDPPTALFGVIRTKNAIEVNFNVLVPRAEMAALASVARQTADASSGIRIMISIDERRFWVVRGESDTVRTGAVAVGSDRTLRRGDSTWTFSTPRGATTVIAREVNPVWIPPDRHYAEIADDSGLALAPLRTDRTTRLRDGTQLVVRGATIGLVGPDTLFRPLPADQEIVFDGTLFVPPFGSRNRRVAGVLGEYRLLLGNSVGLHGTPYKESIGTPATHGCIRLNDDDIAWLYQHVPLGTRVILY
jgi:polyisoprenoid-binding protein YceI